MAWRLLSMHSVDDGRAGTEVESSSFPQTELGEAMFDMRGTISDILTYQGRAAMGLERFDVPPNACTGAIKAVEEANTILQGF